MPEAPGRLRGRRRAAVLISGRGSNLRALIEGCAAPAASAEIALVISNRPDAKGLDWARAQGHLQAARLIATRERRAPRH